MPVTGRRKTRTSVHHALPWTSNGPDAMSLHARGHSTSGKKKDLSLRISVDIWSRQWAAQTQMSFWKVNLRYLKYVQEVVFFLITSHPQFTWFSASSLDPARPDASGWNGTNQDRGTHPVEMGGYSHSHRFHCWKLTFKHFSDCWNMLHSVFLHFFIRRNWSDEFHKTTES